MPAAFDGVRVLELGQIYNGPYCGLPNKYLSDPADAPENPHREDVRRARAGIRRDRPGNRRGLKTAMATVRQWRRRNGLRR